MSVLLFKRRVLAAVAETTPGTVMSLSATHGVFNAYDPKIDIVSTKTKRQGQSAFSKLSAVGGPRSGKATFKTPLGYDGTAIPAWATTFFPACGYTLTTRTFAPKTEPPTNSSAVKLLTIGAYTDGKLRLLSGCSGTFKIVLPTGDMGYIEWDFTGVYAGETDVALIAPDYPNAEKALRCAGGATTWNGVSACMQQATIEAGNVITLRECSTPTAGYAGTVITDREVKIMGNPESRLVAGQDRMLQFVEDTEAALSFTVPGAGTSSIVFAAPKAQIMTITDAERNGVQIDQIEWAANRNADAGDDELTITFNATA
jgi:hypothetical protein